MDRSGADVLRQLDTSLKGLTTDEARRRDDEYASDLLKPRRCSSDLGLLLSQFASPIILILLVAAGPLRDLLGFMPLPSSFLLALGCIVLLYIRTAELAKKAFCRRVAF